MKLLATFLRDLKVSYRSFYIYIEFIMALIIVAVLLFVVPENFDGQGKLYLYLDPVLSNSGIEEALSKDESTLVIMVESLEEVKASLSEDRTAQGASITLNGGKIQYDMVLQGYESDKVRNLLEEVLKLELLKEDPSFDPGTAVRTLEENSERLSDRISYMPILLLLNSAFMGLFIVAAYIFMDKEEGTIRALTVTPVSIREYLLAKSGVMLFTGLFTGLLTTVLVAGGQVHYGLLLILLTASNFFGTAVGLFIASFYDSVIKAMGALYVAIMILAFGAVSYFMPSFSPFFMRVLPSYPLLFAFREVFLKDADTGFVLQNSLLFLGIGTLVFLVSVKRYQKTITV